MIHAFPEVTDEVVRRYDLAAPRYTSYPTVPNWSCRFGPADHAAALDRASLAAEEPLSLYVHLPFCRELCTFCGCNMVVLRAQGQVTSYLDALERELDLVAARLGDRRTLSQIHWGGGTPTSLDEAQLERLWRAIGQHFSVAPGAELAVEIDPAVTRPSQLELLRSFGFNRLSFGVQDLDPKVQEAIHRIQSAEQTEALLSQARRLGFRGLNVDLIYGLPHQTPESWGRTLERVLAMRPDRAAVYSFAYVPEIRHHQRLLPVHALPRGKEKLSLFREAYLAFQHAGFEPIGMDHFALPDDELVRAQTEHRLRRNFQGYSAAPASLTSPEVVAVGATAISFLGGAFSQSVRPLPSYERAVAAGSFATERGLVLSEDDLVRRRIIEEVMCDFWTDLGPGCEAHLSPELLRLQELEREGLCRLRGSELELTPLGRIFVRNVATVFDAYLKSSDQGFSRTV